MIRFCKRLLPLSLLAAAGLWAQTSSTWKIVGWNDLGMHCMDGKDYSMYSILPPYNNIHAHVIDSTGKLVKSGQSVKVTYEAVADPTGSINSWTAGKTNFWDFAQALFGVKLAVDVGLKGNAMPGKSNTARAMVFDAANNQWTAEGIPIGPYDNSGVKNYYPMMRLRARNASGTTLATTDIVLPVSDEIDCRSCHASGSTSAAQPSGGWSFLSDPEKDYKSNVLRIHDDRQKGNTAYANALVKAGYSAKGLWPTVNELKTPILCARCHTSNALGTGYSGISSLTSAVHKHHANAIDPTNMLVLDSVNNRSACYRCHPGSTTKCLRGVMGNATAADGSMLMQCQSCHGNMTAVGQPARNGWLQEPSCENCHTGTATRNNGQIRYTSVFENSGLTRVAVDRTFAANANTPAAGISLYRFSKGHGGLQCEACHGSTHAEYPSSHANDNLQSTRMQGHSGTLAECTACHSAVPSTTNGGPHGLHPIGQTWVGWHGDIAERGASACQSCHGLDYRGTVLSATKADRSFSIEGRKVALPKGTAVGCYNCHNGPRGS